MEANAPETHDPPSSCQTKSSPDLNTEYTKPMRPTTSFSSASKLEDGQTDHPDEKIPNDETTTTTKSKHQHGWRRVVRNFTPSWFAVNMGTGITSILLHNLPYNGQWLQYLSYIIFALNVVLFILFCLISLLRYTLYPRIWSAMLRHPAQSLFLGCFPMALGTIVNMICFVCVPAWGGGWWKLAWGLWWIDVVLASGIGCYLTFMIIATHKPRLETMTAAWLLPIISTIIAAGSGSIVAATIPSATHPNEKLSTLITSYILLGMGLPPSFMVMGIYFLRLTTKQLVAKEATVSCFIPLGPWGMGGFAMQELGKVARELFHETDSLPASTVYAGDILYVFGFLAALIMWGFGLFWLFLAIATIVHNPRFPFNMGWWGFTFPLGVYAVSTTTLGKELPSAFFRVLGTAFSVVVVLLWIFCSASTLWHAWTGEVFVAPCLKDLDCDNPSEQQKGDLDVRREEEDVEKAD